MAGDVEPLELARLVDLSEWPRHDGWSLRAALTRYAQPQPTRASAILEVVRRIDAALPQRREIERDGPSIWEAVESGSDDPLPALLRAALPLDELADTLTRWAPNRSGERPDDDVDSVVASVAERLDELGVPREEREGPPRGRGRSRG